MTFFFDNTFPPKLAQLLQWLGVDARHLRHCGFAPSAPDTHWIPEVGRNGWVVITADVNIRQDPAERVALEAADVVAFFLYAGFTNQRKWDQTLWLLKYWSVISAAAGNSERGHSYLVTKGGRLRLLS